MNALKLILAASSLLLVAQAQAQDFEVETGTVVAIYNSYNNDFEIHYTDAPRAGSVGGRVFQICRDKKPSMSVAMINKAIKYSKDNGDVVTIKHTNTCVDSVTLTETGTLSTIYTDGSFEIHYLDAPRAGSVGGRVLQLCKGDEKPTQSPEVIAQALKWAAQDRNLVIDANIYGDGGTCVHTLTLRAK